MKKYLMTYQFTIGASFGFGNCPMTVRDGLTANKIRHAEDQIAQANGYDGVTCMNMVELDGEVAP